MTQPVGLARGLTNYGDPDFALYLRRSFARSMGYSSELLARPVIGIADSFSGFNNCHRHFPELIEAVKRGVLAMGGLPLTFPTISLGEVFLSPTSLMFRNLMAMDTEEMIRAQPMDAVVLVGGCDKTVPAQLMGAISANRPTIGLVAGPMMTSRWHGERLGACTDCRRFWARYRAGEIDAGEIREIEGNLATTAGTCAVMGTASTMASIAEALGMILPGSAAIPAVHADRLRAAEATGRTAMQLAQSGLLPDRIVTRQSVENALRVLMAIGGSTNAVLHLTAIAGRAGIDLDLRWLNEISDSTPVLVDLKPTGPHYMEDLFAAGGIGAVLRELKPLLHLDCVTVAAETLGQRLAVETGPADRSVVKPFGDPLQPKGGLVALFGSLAPKGAIFKRSAADPKLFEKEGRAVVFTSLEDLSARIDDPDLDVAPDDFLVLQNAGPLSPSGMPEAGYLPIPGKLARAGVKDMVRISDARMSGTAYGSIVLHVTPDAASGGPLAKVRNGDRIRLSVAERRLDLLVAPEELARRPFTPPSVPERGYAALYRREILQADRGCDFDFLRKQPLESQPDKQRTRMAYFLQQLINGLTLGSIYGLIAIGYTMVYGIIGMINFAHGEIYMIGAFVSIIALLVLGLAGVSYIPLALALVLLTTMFFTSIYGWAVERVAYRPLRGSSRLAPLISAIGTSIFLLNYVQILQGARGKPMPPLIQGGFTIYQSGGFGVRLSYLQLLIILVTLALMAGFSTVIATTSLGRAQRACEQDIRMAALLGVDVDRVISTTFMMGAALAAVAGLMVTLYYGVVDFFIGFLAGVKAFTAAVLGGIGSLPGAMLGGILIGLIEAFWSGYFTVEYKDVSVFAVLILVLVFRPTGLLGRPELEKV